MEANYDSWPLEIRHKLQVGASYKPQHNCRESAQQERQTANNSRAALYCAQQAVDVKPWLRPHMQIKSADWLSRARTGVDF